MASDGTLELVQALRTLLDTDSVISNAGVFQNRAPREDALPYLIVIVTANKAHHNLKVTGWREFVVTLKSCAVEAGGKEGIEIAGDLAARAYNLMTKAGLNAALAGLGWTAMEPLEVSALPPYDDTILETQRWCMGNLFHIRIQPA